MQLAWVDMTRIGCEAESYLEAREHFILETCDIDTPTISLHDIQEELGDFHHNQTQVNSVPAVVENVRASVC